MFNLWLFQFLAVGLSLHDTLPRSTSVHDDIPDLWGGTPRPTRAPSLTAAKFNLFRRQDIPQGCGYADGNFSNALTCPNVNYECWTSNGGLGGAHVIGCCSASSIDVYGSIVPDGCLYETACYDSADYLAICTTAPYSCADDVSLRLCTDATAPFCRAYYYDFYVTFDCNSVPNEIYSIYDTATDTDTDTTSNGISFALNDETATLDATDTDSASADTSTSTSTSIMIISYSLPENSAPTSSPTSAGQASAATITSKSAAPGYSLARLRDEHLAMFVLGLLQAML